MKKQLFVLGLAVAALASCTNEEVTDIADSNVIGFKAPFVGNVTKTVANVETANLQNFYVYGYKGATAILTNEKVYKSGTAWGYDDLQKWATGQTWDFAAYSNAGISEDADGKIGTGVSFTTTDGLKIADYETTENKDLVASISTTDISTTNQPVAFTFYHTLAKIKFTIQSAMGNEEMTISDFTVTGVKDKATLTFKKATAPTGGVEISWQMNNTHTDKTISEPTFGTITTAESKSHEYVVIPTQTVATEGMKISFDASIADPESAGTTIDKTLTATIAQDKCDWEAGMCYNYIATVDASDMDVITFTLESVTPWDNTDVEIAPDDLTSQDAN